MNNTSKLECYWVRNGFGEPFYAYGLAEATFWAQLNYCVINVCTQEHVIV